MIGWTLSIFFLIGQTVVVRAMLKRKVATRADCVSIPANTGDVLSCYAFGIFFLAIIIKMTSDGLPLWPKAMMAAIGLWLLAASLFAFGSRLDADREFITQYRFGKPNATFHSLEKLRLRADNFTESPDELILESATRNAELRLNTYAYARELWSFLERHSENGKAIHERYKRSVVMREGRIVGLVFCTITSALVIWALLD
jgi:uncharacterized membrane protein YeiB